MKESTNEKDAMDLEKIKLQLQQFDSLRSVRFKLG